MWEDLNKALTPPPKKQREISKGQHRFLFLLNQDVIVPVMSTDENSALAQAKKSYAVKEDVPVKRTSNPTFEQDKKLMQENFKRRTQGGQNFVYFDVTTRNKHNVEAYVDAPTEEEAMQHAEDQGYSVEQSWGEVTQNLEELGLKNQNRRPGRTNDPGDRKSKPEGYTPSPEGYAGKGKTWEITVTYAGTKPQVAQQPTTQQGPQTGGVPESATNEEWYESLYGKAAARMRTSAAAAPATYSETVTVEAETQDKAIEKVQQKAKDDRRKIVGLESVRVYDEKNKKWMFTHVQTSDWRVVGQDKNGKWVQEGIKANSEEEAQELAKQKGIVSVADLEIYDLNIGNWTDPSKSYVAKAPESQPAKLWNYVATDRKGREFKGQLSAATKMDVYNILKKQGFNLASIEEVTGQSQQQGAPASKAQSQENTYEYEAMDHTGKEVKDTIQAKTQEEAQQLIRQKGFFVTKIALAGEDSGNGKQKSWLERKFGPFWTPNYKAGSLEQHADLIRDTLGMVRTADLVRQAAHVAQAVQETVQEDQDIDSVVVTAVKQVSQDILKVADQLRRTNNITAHRVAAQIEQDFIDALSFPIKDYRRA